MRTYLRNVFRYYKYFIRNMIINNFYCNMKNKLKNKLYLYFSGLQRVNRYVECVSVFLLKDFYVLDDSCFMEKIMQNILNN